MKACSKCKEEKSLDRFHKKKSSKDGFYNVCKDCRKIDSAIFFKRKQSMAKYALIPALLLASALAFADIPPKAKVYMPVVKEQIKTTWPTLSMKSVIPANIEQESCVSLKSSRCWDPRAELKTSRELGIGLGQITIAYDKHGKVRFNNFEEVKKLDKRLKSWKFQDRYNPKYQIMAIVIMDKNNYTRIKFPVANDYEKLSFTFSAYNGGLGSVLQDRKLCETIKGCNPKYWTNNVANHSFKSKIKTKGYGQSFFQINRDYVKNIMIIRRQKYIPYIGN